MKSLHFSFIKYITFWGLHFANAFSCSAQPDSTKGSYFFETKAHVGFLIAHRPSLVPLQQKHLMGIDISAGFFTSGSKYWHKYYNQPAIGVKYSFMQTGNEAVLGNTHSLIPFLEIAFKGRSKTKLGIQYGWGIGYVSKHFSKYDNYKNIAIGSHFNAAINFNFFLRRNIIKNELATGVGLLHFSNGSTVTPNLGINLATLQFAYRFNTGNKKEIFQSTQTDFSFSKKWYMSASVVFGLKQNYPALGENFLIKEICLFANQKRSQVASYGIGIDLPHDPSISQRLDNRGDKTNNLTPFRPGLNIGYSIGMGDLTLGLHQGFYLYSQIKDDGILYQRIALNYNIYKKYFAVFSLKTHFAKADFFEWGLGFRV